MAFGYVPFNLMNSSLKSKNVYILNVESVISQIPTAEKKIDRAEPHRFYLTEIAHWIQYMHIKYFQKDNNNASLDLEIRIKSIQYFCYNQESRQNPYSEMELILSFSLE